MQKGFNFIIATSMILTLTLVSACSVNESNFPTTPQTNHGKKWRIGYLEGGPYANYPISLKALVKALAELGWAEKTEFPPQADENDTRKLWAWMAANIKSDYIEFVPDAYWSNNWDNYNLRPKTKARVIERLNRKKDIDLMLAMGTWAGQDLANNAHSVPTMVLSSSNPLRSGIVKSIEDSGYDHVNARVDPTRYERQVRIFHDIIGFNKLGIVYEQDTAAGRSYAAIEDIKKVAGERGFEITAYHAPASNVSKEEAKQAVLNCYAKLAPQVDAVYITAHRGVTLRKMRKVLAPLNQHNLPTFSQLGPLEVRHGVLLSIAEAGYQYIAPFHAENIAKIFNGARPRDLEQVFEDPPRIAINIKAAQIIGYDPPPAIMDAADEIYAYIATVK